MTVRELNRDELNQLKQEYYTRIQEEKCQPVSYKELVNIDDLVSDKEIFEEYNYITFTKEDFWCNV